MLTNTQRKAHLPVWPTPFCRVNESPCCIPDLWERDHTFKFLCAMSNLSMLKKKGPKGIMILKLSPTILKIYLIKITDLQPQNGQKPRQVSCRATPLPWSSTVPSLTVSCFAQATGFPGASGCPRTSTQTPNLENPFTDSLKHVSLNAAWPIGWMIQGFSYYASILKMNIAYGDCIALL